jgi:hypothetical protein
LRPTQELYIKHRKELTDPWVGTGASRHREMIARLANELIDEVPQATRVIAAGIVARSRSMSRRDVVM